MKRVTFPKCGSCDLTVPIVAEPGNFWCHGAPPSAQRRTMVKQVDGSPTQVEVTTSDYPPVHTEMTGCAMHPQIRRKLK